MVVVVVVVVVLVVLVVVMVMADQFARLKTGNRLFWEHESSLMTVEQKTYIKGVTLAHLLCANLPSLRATPKNSFLPPSDSAFFLWSPPLPPGSIIISPKTLSSS
ncbi:hypothetical protein E2C01_015808 [Portunus trituberculatus]|uniref:Uncharacterized protein n=1 Tax=Portunus trituberculatus TaxID=210409 RepID=A0A5B7DMF9_PORTR|nr:hypothetical protein [Portunus trituberculatus]